MAEKTRDCADALRLVVGSHSRSVANGVAVDHILVKASGAGPTTPRLTVSAIGSGGRSEFVVRRTHRAFIGGSSFDLVRLPASTSFVAQRNHGIHTGGAAGWDVSGEHRDGQNSCWNHEV